jgi:hypothetical protein
MQYHERPQRRLTLAGRVPQGHIILCACDDADEHTFLVKSLGISVECPQCGTTRAGVDLAVEAYPEAEEMPRRYGT